MNKVLVIHDRLTISGKTGFLISVLLTLSIFVTNRIEVLGLLLHPFLVALPVAILISRTNLFALNVRVLLPLFIFLILMFFSCLRNEDGLQETSKIGASVLTFLFFSQTVRSTRDFRWVSWGFLICSWTVGFLGFQLGNEVNLQRLSGVNILEGIGNKNAQSLFTLPGLFLGIWLLLDALKRRKLLEVVVLSTAIFFIVVQIFLSANRSGWLGLLVISIAYITYSGVRYRTVLISIMLVIFTYVAIEKYALDIFEYKKRQTIEGNSSDDIREELSIESIKIGIENPIFGLGADELHQQLSQRLGLNFYGFKKVDTHFLIGYLAGSSGFIVLFIFFLFLIRLQERPPFRLNDPMIAADLFKRRLLMILFIVLFIVRSFFTREILYNPTFVGALGLIYGYYQLGIRNAAHFIRR